MGVEHWTGGTQMAAWSSEDNAGSATATASGTPARQVSNRKDRTAESLVVGAAPM